ncbi:MAG TPA: biosynthetic-type acetolactate synthase large subunit [Paludibacteraceae bacterium]|nr:biosynthetic-type acetolactate synthase large subunit [Paludibacteraceae bacterium]HOO24766.1 biosynthetic-type acetolactate synthase large subunit [Paludibacteraceae bacterium]HOS37086.1 biosynthetic-type acetolactate synthase large subunit [Paludibacteraceae bacterium]HPK19991.1 biosynthetic-type acetolactate synthase large subunit [Paludibacteraceae bacterium]HRR58043.1 biosynthetic-type acetolactate synthase large subunit [Paludibacteraceae bacterium]
MKTTQLSGAHAFIHSIMHEGTDTIFGYPGGAIIPVFDALYDYFDKIHYVLGRHEQGSIHAAQGYARISGKVGVCIVTSGPAATNVITGIGDAMLDSTPLVVITGQVGTNLLGTDAFQEIDVVGITQPITKWSYQIRRPEEIAWAVARAFYIARSGRKGPVVLDFTKNAQTGLVKHYQPEKCTFIRSYVPVLKPNIQKIEEAAQLINQAKKPFALVGQGVALGNAEEELKDFLTKADIPAGWTLLGESVMPSDFPLNKGMLGMHGNIAPNLKTNECDVLIAIGMRFDDRVTGDLSTYAKQAKVIHFDIDAAEIGKNIPVEVPILGNVKTTLPLVTKLLNKNTHTEWIASFEEAEQKEKELVIDYEIHPKNGAIKMGETIAKISEATRHEAVVVTDVGQNQMMAARYSKFTQPKSFITSGGLGTMGFGVPAAIGAKIGAPDRTVVLFVGDGGFQMTMQELGTIMQEKIGVKIVILNNNYLGMVRQWQELFHAKRYSSTPMQNPDFVAIAKAYGIKSERVSERSKLDTAIDTMLANDEPYLLVVDVEESGLVYPMIPAGTCVTNIIVNGEKIKL